jgi:hypothetical protein
VGGFQLQCAWSATVAADVSFSAQSVANPANFGIREFRQSRHECEQASSYNFCLHNPGAIFCGANVRSISLQMWQDSVSAQ